MSKGNLTQFTTLIVTGHMSSGFTFSEQFLKASIPAFQQMVNLEHFEFRARYLDIGNKLLTEGLGVACKASLKSLSIDCDYNDVFPNQKMVSDAFRGVVNIQQLILRGDGFWRCDTNTLVTALKSGEFPCLATLILPFRGFYIYFPEFADAILHGSLQQVTHPCSWLEFAGHRCRPPHPAHVQLGLPGCELLWLQRSRERTAEAGGE